MAVPDRIRPLAILAAALATAWLPVTPAAADQTLSVQVENDYFSPDNRDRHYTNGLRFAWLPEPSGPGEASGLEALARDLPFGESADASEGRVGWSFGQSIFTPQNTAATQPLPNDRPYAGWLYVGLALLKSAPASECARSCELDTLETELGVVGRAAEGKFVQRAFHRAAFANEDPKGWGNQLKSEPGILISYDHKWRGLVPFQPIIREYGFDVTPDLGADLGNVETSAAAGLSVRLGKDLPADYGPPRIRPGLAGSDFFRPPTEAQSDFGWYIFAGAEGRAVGHNIFLDGNSFAKSLSVPKKTLVADLQGGLAVVVGRVRITGTEVLRTQEFIGQHGRDVFGSISASVAF